jgi:hypothetical protein
VFYSFLTILTLEVGEIILLGLEASTAIGIGFGEMIAG